MHVESYEIINSKFILSIEGEIEIIKDINLNKSQVKNTEKHYNFLIYRDD